MRENSTFSFLRACTVQHERKGVPCELGTVSLERVVELVLNREKLGLNFLILSPWLILSPAIYLPWSSQCFCFKHSSPSWNTQLTLQYNLRLWSQTRCPVVTCAPAHLRRRGHLMTLHCPQANHLWFKADMYPELPPSGFLAPLVVPFLLQFQSADRALPTLAFLLCSLILFKSLPP